MYIASKSAVSEIRSLVSPVINSLPNSSSRSVTRQGFFGEILKHSEPNAKSFSRAMQRSRLWYRYIKKPRKTVDFPWLLKYLIEKS